MSGSAISDLDTSLARHRVGLTGDDVLSELDTALAAIPGAGAAPLSATELTFLR